MAKFIRCPKCETQVNVTNVGGGSIVQCECGVKLRVPTGQTAIRQAPAAPPPPPAAEKQGSKRQTAIMRKMAGVKAPGEGGRPSRMPAPQGGGNSKQGLIIGLAAVGVILVAGVAFLMSGKTEKPKAPAETPKKSTAKAKTPAPASSAFTPQPAPAEKFEKGARVIATVLSGGKLFDLGLNAGLRAEFEALASADKTADIVREDYKWLVYIFEGLLSDSEAVARGSFQALFDISRKRAVNQDCNNRQWPSAEIRAGEYNSWVFRWWLNRANQAIVAKWAEDAGAPPPPAGGAAPDAAAPVADGNWDSMVKDLQNGGMDDTSTPAGSAFSRIQRLGKSAYPQLVKYIGNEDLSYARIAVAALKKLTKHETALPNESTRDAIKKDWEEWIKTAP